MGLVTDTGRPRDQLIYSPLSGVTIQKKKSRL